MTYLESSQSFLNNFFRWLLLVFTSQNCEQMWIDREDLDLSSFNSCKLPFLGLLQVNKAPLRFYWKRITKAELDYFRRLVLLWSW